MAYFDEREGICEDCTTRSENLIVTDLFDEPDTIRPGSRDVEGLCFDCYLRRLDAPVRHVSLVRLSSGTEEGSEDTAVLGAEDEETLRVLEKALVGSLDDVSTEVSSHSLRDVYASTSGSAPDGEVRREHLSTYYCREIARGSDSVNRHIYTRAGEVDGRTTVMDDKSCVSEWKREAVRRKLADAIVEEARDSIETRDDIGEVVEEKYPVLHEHGVTSGVGRRVWREVRGDSEVLSEASRRSLRNQREGDEFEAFLERLCEERGYDCYRGKEALRTRFPEAERDLLDRFGSLNGVPDYLVSVEPGQERLADNGGWMPDGDAFVEVKRGDSRLSPEQERVIPYLKSHGFEMYVLRGDPDDFFFERR
ncbi:MAG: VRR-NUC domain-containing protein [Halobacteria archaeon]|nr:VRR-NUC domain-containing protein [Halobacteria archaeon]